MPRFAGIPVETSPAPKPRFAGVPVESAVPAVAPAGSFREAQRQAVTEDRGALSASVTGGGQGLTFGFGDEIMAGAFTPIEMAIGAFTGEDEGKGILDRMSSSYGRGLDLQRTQIETAEKNYPIASTVGELGGGLALGAAAAPSLFPSGAGIVGNTLRGAGAGAVGGAAAGFGEGEGFDDRKDKAITGGALGLGVGAAAPAAGALIGSGVRAVRDSKIARDVLAPVGLGRRSAGQIEREMGRDGLTAATARAEADRMGPDAMMLDVGRNLGEGADAVVNRPGAGAATVRDRLRERSNAASTRITAAADTAMGPQRNIAETVDALIADRKAASQPLYDAALGKPIVWNDRLQAFIDDPVVRKGLREGVEIQRLESLADGTPFNPLDFAITGIDEVGDPIITGVPNMRTLSVAKKWSAP